MLAAKFVRQVIAFNIVYIAEAVVKYEYHFLDGFGKIIKMIVA
ncbi:hypothetical protein [Thermoanaerobacterium sp. R66]|jgi:hypothetical protein|nr:hypothetical protein [Thermoanaerobacterium sp. R66]